MIRILVVDDHEVVRQGLRFALEQEPDLTVVGECVDGATALAAISELRPDVVLLDMVMPGMDGLGVLHALRERDDPAAVIVLTSFPAEDRALDVVRAGAVSYLSKSTAVDRVVEAVRAAATGGSVLDPDVAALLVRGVRAGDQGPLSRLSARERDVLALISRGRSNREIARALMLGEQTVKSYVSSVLTKLDLQDRTQAAIFGLQQGVVALGDALKPDPD
ncbi:response regulator transcription factor [Dactylosporangium maewongense]|uniref:Response regulator transcription factor n=1 Tax=Dactylosporangium maewongense TaxID=634393 RepID=A0ABP4MFK9_9ACTN